MDLRIDQPLWLLLCIPFAIYFIWAWRKGREHFRREHAVAYALRALSILLLIFAITGPYLLLPVKDEQILFVIDRSASAAGNDEWIYDWIEESLDSKNANQSVGVYTFGGNFQTEVKLSDEVKEVPIFSGLRETGDTNIEQALQLASSVAESNKATRIVLISDGLETRGSVSDELFRLAGGNIQIDTVPLKQTVNEDVAITSFETPPVAFEGEQQQLIVEVESSSEKEGELLLLQNDKLLMKQAVKIEPGTNTYSFRHASTGNGLLKYEVQLIVPDDGLLENNKLTSVTTVESSPRLLVVHGKDRQSPIPGIIDAQVVETDMISAEMLPYDLSNYLDYDAIIFDNVPGHLVGEQKMGVIEQAVKNFGVGFMMVGGENSFGLGGYFKSPIEKLLPVEMEVKGKQQLPSLGIVIVLDRSGSMMGSKLELAKEAAARSVELLRDGDTLGFIAFDDRPWEIIETGELTDKEEAVNQILSVPAGGGTEIYSSLEMAFQNLQDLKLQRKHIILLTDGQSATQNDYQALIEEGLEHNTTLSTVSIGQDADRNLLEMLAEIGAGRYYDVQDESTIPAILSRETVMISRTYIEDNPFYPAIGGDPVWTSLFDQGVPQMNAYIATTAKQTASVVMESEQEDPVLAEWMYGLGRTIAYTSDSPGAWSGDFARWERWPDLWNTAVSRLLPSFNEIPFDIRRSDDGSYIIQDPSGNSSFLDVAVVNERGEEIEVMAEPIAPGKTRVTMETDPGLVFFRVSNESEEVYQAGLSVPYSDEYRLQQPDEGLLNQISERTGGQVLEEPSQAFRNLPYESAERQSIQKALIFSSLLLFFVDITIRRFGWRNIRTISQVVQRKREPESVQETLHVEQLLKLKKKR
ncbi:VWA domain-containing protein [Chungangia koreensis]|uniref:VWA domain-containing protein n=1 Tax=Chungangia koreensis TaxID=752657 RepID=A0ABV8X203_9LACT